jgi:hypothetical protein
MKVTGRTSTQTLNIEIRSPPYSRVRYVNNTTIIYGLINKVTIKEIDTLNVVCLFVFLALQPIVVVFSQPSSGL